MASLNGQTIASSYEQLLHTDTDGGGNGNTLVTIKDGDNGTTFGLKLATNKVEVIPSAADDANAFEVSKNDGTAVFTVNTSSPGLSLAGNATITTADNSDNLALVSTDTDANAGPNLSFWRNSANPDDNDLLGQINWYAENDADEKTHMAQFYVTSMDVSDGTEDVRFVIQTILGGATETSRIELLPSETVINQDSKDIDFRVESDGGANMLFVDAGNDKVGINTNSPDNLFHIEFADGSDTTAANIASDNVTGIQLTNTTNSNGNGTMLLMESNNGSNQTAIGHIQDDATSSHMAFYTELSGTFSEKMRIQHDGKVGIGTSSPTDVKGLHIKSNQDSDFPLLKLESDSTARDAAIVLINDGGNTFTIGLDASDSDKFKISDNAQVGTNDRLVIDSSGNVGIGESSPDGRLEISDGLGQVSTGVYISNTRNANNNNFIRFRKSRQASGSDETIITSGDYLGQIEFQGADATNGYETGAVIYAVTEGTIGSNQIPTNLQFHTENTSGTLAERMRITSGGKLGIGTTFGENIASTGDGNLTVRSSDASNHYNIVNVWQHSNTTTNIEQRIGWAFGDDGGGESSFGFAGYVGVGKQDAWNVDSARDSYMAFAVALNNTVSERMRITSDGFVTVGGSTTNNVNLTVNGTSASARVVPQTDDTGYIGQSTLRWQALYATNGTIQTSDKNLKTSITSTDLGLDFINKLNPVNYKWKIGGYDITEATIDEKTGKEKTKRIETPVSGKRKHYGLIAQEVKEVLGDNDFGGWVKEDLEDDDSLESLRYDQFIAPLIKAVQELSAKVEALENA